MRRRECPAINRFTRSRIARCVAATWIRSIPGPCPWASATPCRRCRCLWKRSFACLSIWRRRTWMRAGVGGRVREVAEVERKLRLTLPPAMREWVAFSRDLIDAGRFESVPRDVYEVEDLDGLSAVSLLLQGEADFYWAVQKENLQAADP